MSTKYEIVARIYDKRGRVLSVGKNSYSKTHPLQAHYAKRSGYPDRIYLHAEIAAIASCKSLGKAYLISISRLGRSGETRLAKPCATCQAAIKQSGIKIVEYTV